MEKKDDVNICGLQPETLFGILICKSVFEALNQPFCITSVCDGQHKEGSKHYDGFAFDLRIFSLRGIGSMEMRDRLQRALGGQFDVVLEPTHIHVEFDP